MELTKHDSETTIKEFKEFTEVRPFDPQPQHRTPL